ncbi:hypothetical protein [Roseovarius sp.]|uniref:hypothetical protein n=1 Tax=Roseovarius sp. TaxID=1486281 RepID=UPI00262CCE11|nr:hypothetical protein [Roseovarius sp.]MDM8167538.1 hypothetical protein [Roseovarius sp.]
MTADETGRETRLFITILVLTMAMMVMKAVLAPAPPIDTLAVSDNDDIMRFLSVRALLEGQAWYDMTQYRMLPPAGLDLHWSRYVDAPIAALVWVAAQVVPMAQAEAFALVAWPTLLFLLLLLATGFAARRVFGTQAAIVSMIALALWPPTGLTYFGPARIDHHNVQILLTCVVLITLLLPGRPVRLGLAGGLAAAMSLAVGLEMLVTLALAGVVLLVQTVLRQPGKGWQLVVFALALSVGAVLLFVGQTPPVEWPVPKCDELSPPFLALAGVGALICIAAAVISAWMGSLGLRVVAVLGVTAIGLAVVYPLIAPCFGGPYGNLPAEVQALISTRITEARPALPPLLAGDEMAFRFVFPAAAAVMIATLVWGVRAMAKRDGVETTGRVAILLAFGWLGVIACQFQIRLVLMGAAAVPFLMGYAIAALLPGREGGGARAGRAVALAGTVALTLLSPTLFTLVRSQEAPSGPASGQASTTAAGSADASDCRTAELVRSLDAAPPGLVLTSSNFGPVLLLLTDHTALAGPYHRSAEAVANGALPFDGDETALRSALASTGADYLLLCREARYGDGSSFATELARTGEAPGLEPVEGPDPALILLRVTGDGAG